MQNGKTRVSQGFLIEQEDLTGMVSELGVHNKKLILVVTNETGEKNELLTQKANKLIGLNIERERLINELLGKD